MSETKQEQDWVALGTSAVLAGMPIAERLSIIDRLNLESQWADYTDAWESGFVPDFRDRLTSKACELWVEDVALEVDGVSDSIAFCYGDFEGLHTVRFWKNGLPFSRSASTRPEACIDAVKAMRGAG